MYQLSPVALCWVPNRPPPPHDDRTVTGHRELAAGHVAVLGQLVDDGVAGRGQEVREHDLDDRAQPVMDMPRATPMKPFSQMGVASTRPGNLSGSPMLVLNTPPSASTSSPMSRTAGRPAISSSSAALMASR